MFRYHRMLIPLNAQVVFTFALLLASVQIPAANGNPISICLEAFKTIFRRPDKIGFDPSQIAKLEKVGDGFRIMRVTMNNGQEFFLRYAEPGMHLKDEFASFIGRSFGFEIPEMTTIARDRITKTVGETGDPKFVQDYIKFFEFRDSVSQVWDYVVTPAVDIPVGKDFITSLIGEADILGNMTKIYNGSASMTESAKLLLIDNLRNSVNYLDQSQYRNFKRMISGIGLENIPEQKSEFVNYFLQHLDSYIEPSPDEIRKAVIGILPESLTSQMADFYSFALLMGVSDFHWKNWFYDVDSGRLVGFDFEYALTGAAGQNHPLAISGLQWAFDLGHPSRELVDDFVGRASPDFIQKVLNFDEAAIRRFANAIGLNIQDEQIGGIMTRRNAMLEIWNP